MNPMVIAALVGAGMGMIQGNEQKKAFKEQQKIEAIKQRWSAFTNQRGQSLNRPSQMAPVMQGAMGGAMFGQQLGGGGAAPQQNAYAMGNTSQTSVPMQQQTPMNQDWRNPGSQGNMYG